MNLDLSPNTIGDYRAGVGGRWSSKSTLRLQRESALNRGCAARCLNLVQEERKKKKKNVIQRHKQRFVYLLHSADEMCSAADLKIAAKTNFSFTCKLQSQPSQETLSTEVRIFVFKSLRGNSSSISGQAKG